MRRAPRLRRRTGWAATARARLRCWAARKTTTCAACARPRAMAEAMPGRRVERVAAADLRVRDAMGWVPALCSPAPILHSALRGIQRRSDANRTGLGDRDRARSRRGAFVRWPIACGYGCASPAELDVDALALSGHRRKPAAGGQRLAVERRGCDRTETEEELERRQHDAQIVELPEDREEVGQKVERPDQIERRSRQDGLGQRSAPLVLAPAGPRGEPARAASAEAQVSPTPILVHSWALP